MTPPLSHSTEKYYTQKSYPNLDAHIVEGNFPTFEDFKELAIFKFNRFLITLLIFAIIATMVSYSTVIAKETSLTSLHKDITDLNYENIELQNKVDYVKSFYNVDKKVSATNILKKPDDVMEVQAVIPNVAASPEKQKLELKTVLGY